MRQRVLLRRLHMASFAFCVLQPLRQFSCMGFDDREGNTGIRKRALRSSCVCFQPVLADGVHYLEGTTSLVLLGGVIFMPLISSAGRHTQPQEGAIACPRLPLLCEGGVP